MSHTELYFCHELFLETLQGISDDEVKSPKTQPVFHRPSKVNPISLQLSAENIIQNVVFFTVSFQSRDRSIQTLPELPHH